MNKLIYSSKRPVIYSCLLTPTSLIETGFSNFQILPQTLYFCCCYFLFTGEEEEVGPDSSVDEEVSSNSRGIRGGGSGQAAVLEVLVFRFYHRLCHFFCGY